MIKIIPTSALEEQVDVSVIIPTFNRLWSLPRAIDSCRGAKCRTQIIVVDDGSTDGTWEWLQGQDDICALRQENQGQTWAVNHGQRFVRGTYVRFLDSDDYLNTGTIDLQFDAAVATGADVTYGRVDRYIEETGTIEKYPDVPMWDDFTAVALGEGYGSHLLGMLFLTSFVVGIPRRPDFALREDRMFLLEVALRQPKISPVTGCTGYWVKHDQQMHDSYRGLQSSVATWQNWKLLERTVYKLEAAGELTPRRARAAARVFWSTAHEIARTHLHEAKTLVQSAYKLDPAFVPPDDGVLRWFYACFGYVATQRLLRLRRTLLRRAD